MLRNSTPTRCVIYCRVSSEGQEDNPSLPTQIERCTAHAQAQGWTVVAVESESTRGADLHGREGLQRALTLIEHGGADVLLAYATDRLSREQLHIGVILDRVLRAGASLQFATEDFENSPVGKFLLSARTFAAELELAKIAERTGRGRRARVASGKPIVGSHPAYGYQWNSDKTRYLIDPETAPVVRLVFDWALAGVSLRGIGTRLTERGISSPGGKPHWTPMSVRHILTRPVYSGDAVAYRDQYDRRPTGGYTRHRRPIEECVVLPGIAPPIVSKDEQLAVQAHLAMNQSHSSRNNRKPEAALLRTGFIKCGHCGWSLGVNNFAHSQPPRAPQYRCGSRHTDCPHPAIAASVIDHIVWAKVSEVLSHSEIIAREVTVHREDGGLERQRDAADARLAAIVAKQQRIARAVATVDDDAAAEPLLAELKTLATARAAVERERDDLARRITDQTDEDARIRSLAEWCETVTHNLDRLSYSERRMALDALGVQVRVWRHGEVDADGTSSALGHDSQPEPLRGWFSVSLYQWTIQTPGLSPISSRS